MKKSLKISLATFCALAVMGFAPSMAMAQSDDIMKKQIPSLEYQQADVREALRAMFRTVPGASYTIAPDVQGNITVSLKNVSFEAALQNITKQVDATYRIEGGVINIIHRIVENVAPVSGPDAPTNAGTNKVIRRIKIRSADPQFIAMLIGQKEGSQNFTLSPEMSTLSKSGGMGGMGGGMGGMGGGMGGMGGGGMGGMGGGMGGFGGGGMGGMGGGMGGGGGFGGMGGGGFGGMGGGGFGGGR